MKRIASLIIILVIDFRSYSSPTGCQNDEWQCTDGTCIPSGGRCDNFPDCMDNSDEKNCPGEVCLEGLESCPQPNGTTVCVVKAVGCSCGPVKEIDNGEIESDNITIGSEATVVCNAGYDATLPTVTCQVTGLWEIASCLPKDCGPVTKISFGKVILSDIDNTTYGANADVECDVGFETLTPVIRCDETGNWETAVCTAKDCGPVTKISFGKVILRNIDNTTYGANADVVCDVGFDTLTPVIRCDKKGSWGTAVCTAKDCGPVTKISFGKVILSDIDNTTYGAKADVECAVGFETLTTVIRCDETGNWETAVCTAKDCGAPGKMAFGIVTLSDINNTTYGANADVVCNVGFETLTPVIKCDEKGSWEIAVCTVKDCGAPGMIAFGKVTLSDIDNTTYGANADVECDVGFETLTPVIRCGETGSWETAVCTAKDCGSTPTISFGKITLSDDKNSTFGATATVTCDSGYLENKQNIICQSSGLWEDAACLPRDCGPVQSISFGTIVLADSNNTTFGASAVVTCNVGYISNTTEVLCLKSGLWERAECTIRGCGFVPEIPYGKIKAPANDSFGSFASVMCDKGYEANVSSVFCKISGQWESASCTIKDCGLPPLIKYGNTFLGNDNKTTYGATASVFCRNSYVATKSIIKCQSSGTWENAACVFKGCGSLPKISHGTIKAPPNVSIGSFANVTCDTGYEANVSSVMCKWPGLWEAASCKAKDCGHTPVIPFGQSRPINYRNTSYGASASVTCFRGYEPNVSSILCQSTGIWQAAVCRPKSCGRVPTILHGRIVSTGNASVGSTGIVTCDVGYTANVSSVMCKSSGLWEQAKCSATNSTRLQCYKCRNECSNSVCNQETEICPHYKQSCYTTVLRKYGYYTLKKGCKRPSAFAANRRPKCRRIGYYKIVCRYECNGNLCNWDLPQMNLYG